MGRRLRWMVLVAAVPAFWLPASAPADLIRLRNGGEVRGSLDRNTSSRDSRIVIETLNGTVVVVEREQIEFLTHRTLAVEEYETRARRAPDTVAAHWELAEWCRDRGLAGQRTAHLERIIELEPGHEGARLALGHVNRGGRWLTRDEDMAARGYVKHKGRYITPQELELIERSDEMLEREREWHRRVRLWHGWLTGSNATRSSEGRVELLRISDPDAVPALVRFMSEDSQRPVRELYVQVLGQIRGDRPVAPLVKQSLYDVDGQVRFGALNALGQDQYEAAMPLFARELKNPQNPIVLRAAAALERVGDQRAIPSLIDALLTTHTYRVLVPDPAGSTGFRTDGSIGAQPLLPPEVEIQLRTGQIPGAIVRNPSASVRQKVVTIRHQHQNEPVLAALQKITGENFGYEKRAWRLWHTAHKSGALDPANTP